MWKLNWTELGIDWDRLKDVLTYDASQPMIFNSGFFLLLFLGFSLIYLILQKKTTARLLFVTLFSYYFYYKSSGFYFFLLGIVTVSDFLLARRMEQTVQPWKRKLLVVCSLCINLGLLCYFKYTNFFYEMLAPLWHGQFEPLDIFLPVGISFFTFQSLSYTIDVYRRDLKPLTNLLDYAFYVSFFPQLVAGPIVRARDFIPQIRQPLFVSSEMFGQGVFFIVSGLFKKAVISDYISVNFVERIFDNPGLYSGLENLFGVYGYALQIYCDFSGYVALALHKFFRNLLGRPKQYRSRGIRKFFAVVLTFHFVCFCWIFFRNSTFEASVTMIRQIFTAFHPELLEQLLTGYWKVFALMGVGFLLHFCPDSWQNACSRGMVRMPLIAQALIMIALIYLVIQVKSSDIQPFIYFQF